MLEVAEHLSELDGLPVFWRSASCAARGETSRGNADREATPPDHEATSLFLHGVPTSSTDWLPFLERSGGLAPDLPGFGRSGKPGHYDYSITGYEHFIERFLEHVGVERVNLVLHDWGAVGLAFAQRHPERVRRLVIINVVPFFGGYRWHRTARVWRTPLLGELAMGATGRTTLRFASREANATRGSMPESWLDEVLEHFDQGTQRAILRLYRSSPENVLAAAGENLGALSMPTLVVWGIEDPYIPARFGREYATVLENSEFIPLAGAGHWPWLDRPEAIDRVMEFLSRG